MDDPVNHPKHYTQGSIETIEMIDLICADYSGSEGASLGAVVKYISRAPYKGQKLQDLRKAHWYLGHLIELIEAKEKSAGQEAATPKPRLVPQGSTNG
jgi:hypothetical protein